MTSPVIPIDVQVSGADQGTSQLLDLQDALSGVTVGAGAMEQGLSRVQNQARNGLFGGRNLQEAISYQQALSGLNATAAVTHQSMSGLSNDVMALSRAMPGGTQQMIQTVQATQALGLSQKNQVGQIRELSGEFTKLAAATGSYAPAIATDFGELNRQLANLDPSRISRFSDVVTTLQARTGANVSGMIGFAQSIAPVAQQANLGESAILGISASFVKLGDDGGAAATAVNKILSDLNDSVKEGTNQMVAYANATGMTVTQFRRLYEANPTQALTDVTTAIGKNTPQSSYLLQTLGLDSTRTQRALLELSQSGGLSSTISTAVSAYGNGSTSKAASAAFSNVNDQLQRLSTTASQAGEAIEGPLLRPLGTLLHFVQDVAAPLVHLVGSVAGNRVGGDLLSAGLLGGLGALGAGRGAFGLARRLVGPAWLGVAGTSGPVNAALAGARYGRYGADDGAFMSETGMFGFMGRRSNQMLEAGINGAPMGRGGMGTVNRGIFDFFTGRGQQWRAGTAGASYLNPDAQLPEELAQNEAAQSYMSPMMANYSTRRGLGAASRVFGGAATTASLGWQGYWRMFSQPFRMLQQSPLERDGSLTDENGPSRALFSGLKGAWSDRDMDAAKASLRDFTSEVGGARQAVARVFMAPLQAVGDVGSAMGPMARAGGGMALSGLSSLLSNLGPMLAIGGAFGGYEMWKSSKTSAANMTAGSDPTQMYGVLNEYRDSMGEAGVAAVNLAQQLTTAAQNVASTVTTFKQASRVSSADVQAWGLPNAKKTIHRMTGTPSEVAGQISAVYAGQGISVQDMQGVAHDLYNQGYSTQEIDQILSMVPQGAAGQSLTASTIQAQVTHALKFTGSQNRSFSDFLKRGPESNYSPSAWSQIGRTGYGSPSIGSSGKSILSDLSTSILQTAATNETSGKGTRYTTAQEITQGSTELSQALKTHNASLVVYTEQALTRALTGNAITGLSAADIQQEIANHPNTQSLAAVLYGHGASVNGLSIPAFVRSGGLSAAAASSTPTAITALAGGQSSMFAPFFSGGRGGTTGIVTASQNQPGNLALNQQAADAIVASLQAAGESLSRIAGTSERNLGISGSQGNLMAAVFQQTQQQLAYTQIGMTQGQQLRSTMQSNLAPAQYIGNNQAQITQRQQSIQTEQGAMQDLTSYYQQRIQAQFQYQIQSTRAEQDYTVQMGRNEYQYQLQDVRNTQDYYLQKLRAQQDYQTQMQRAVLSAASSGDYDPYSRIQTQPVMSAEDLETNLAGQDQAISQQVRNLHTARQLGVTNSAIQVLGLAQTTNAQQLQELVDDFMGNPQLVAQLNTEVSQRLQASGQLYKDPGDVSYTQAKQDFDRQMNRTATDFNIQQARMKQDFQTQQEWAAQDFSLQMSRMAQDAHDQDLAVTGDMNDLQKTALQIMHGQTVDWKNVLHDNLSDMLSETKESVKQVTSVLQQGAQSVSADTAAITAQAAHGLGGGGNGGASVSVSGDKSGGGGTVAGDGSYITSVGPSSGSVPLVGNKNTSLGGGGAVGNNAVTGRQGKQTWVAAGHGATTDVTQIGGSGDVPSVAYQKQHPPIQSFNKGIAKAMMSAMYGWGTDEYNAIDWVWGQHESGWDQYAYAANLNDPPAAYGIPQSRPGDKMAKYGSDWRTNPATQIKWGLDYIHSNYGSPQNIPGIYTSNYKGYATGGIATSPHVGLVAEAGVPEAMVPLNAHGVAYLAKAISTYISSSDAASITSGGRAMALHIDNRTYIENSGHHIDHVEVKASSPKEMYDAMDQKVRRNNLTNKGRPPRAGG